MSGGTSQPATETLQYTLEELGYETGLDGEVLKEIGDFFKPIRAEYLKNGQLNPTVLATDTKALSYQVPGGMLSNLVAQLTAQGKMDKFDEVLLETPRVREDLGYPPLVTPMSQMVGVQATNNVLAGERYKNVSKEVKSYLRGEYGKAPGEVNEDVRKQILGDAELIKGRYADTLEPEFEKAKAEIGNKAKSDEDVLSYIAFPAQAEKFFDYREEMKDKTYTYEFKYVE
jgi:oxaloacetate decarboxylase alpha subunit